MISRDEAGVPADLEIAETGDTFEENSMIKAKAIMELSDRVADRLPNRIGLSDSLRYCMNSVSLTFEADGGGTGGSGGPSGADGADDPDGTGGSGATRGESR